MERTLQILYRAYTLYFTPTTSYNEAYTYFGQACNDLTDAVTPVTVPDAPTIGTATGGNAEATVSFTAPVSNGGSAILFYTVTSNPEGKTATGSASPLRAC